jgi:hypothetical protein
MFGSVARGIPARWSDVDIGVLGAPFWRGLEIGARLTPIIGREAHVVDLATASTWLRYLVARDGILLFESEPGAWSRAQAEAALQWFDVQPIVALCGEGAKRSFAQAGRIG